METGPASCSRLLVLQLLLGLLVVVGLEWGAAGGEAWGVGAQGCRESSSGGSDGGESVCARAGDKSAYAQRRFPPLRFAVPVSVQRAWLCK